MSRVGKHPVQIPQGVNITVAGQSVTVSGKLGSKSYEVHALVSVKHENGAVSVAPINDSKNARMQWGTAQRQIASLVKGVSEGFTLNLDLVLPCRCSRNSC
jgi:large subunit ribosomal protein L6